MWLCPECKDLPKNTEQGLPSTASVGHDIASDMRSHPTYPSEKGSIVYKQEIEMKNAQLVF